MPVQDQVDLDKIIALIDQNRNLNCLRLTINQKTLVGSGGGEVKPFYLPGEGDIMKMDGETTSHPVKVMLDFIYLFFFSFVFYTKPMATVLFFLID